ncbi:MAG: sugar phosphate nucleotidyltransferase, partial [Candidatus Theseobacter exili]|nr:sugar phosphate nucleotidyltransferase [Candidatus Theseobacter exili]
MKNVTAVIMGGGRGTRLFPLTYERAKPSVSFAGKYRLIDIPISNCINSGIKRVFVLTQFLSASLHRHIMQTYHFDSFTDGFIDVLAAEQTPQGSDWFQGTADAVRATLKHTTYYKSDQILILSGDHLYRMNYAELIRAHRNSRADITVCVNP